MIGVAVLSGGCRGTKEAATAGSSPTTPSTPTIESLPLEAKLTVKVDGASGREAIAVASDVAVELNVTGGTGRLRYTVSFGDGSGSNEALSHHTYQNPAGYTVVAVVTDDAGRSQTLTQNVVVKTFTGTWFHAGWNREARKFERRLLTITDQEGSTVRGFYGLTSTPDRSVSGTLGPGRVVRLVVNGGEVLDGVAPERLGVDVAWPLLGHGAQVDGTLLSFTPVIGVPSTPPPDAVLTVVPNSTSSYPMIVAGRSRTLYDGSRSRGERLSYIIEFGDGGVIEAESTQHMFSEFIDEDPYALCVGWPTRAATLWVVDRFGRVDSESITLPLLRVVTNCAEQYFNWGSTNNPLPGFDWNVAFATRNGDSVTGRLGSGRFTGTFAGERELQLMMENGDEYNARFDFDASGRFSHWGAPTPYLLTLTQTKGAHLGLQWLLILDSYA